jgi:hypothetical protein
MGGKPTFAEATLGDVAPISENRAPQYWCLFLGPPNGGIDWSSQAFLSAGLSEHLTTTLWLFPERMFWKNDGLLDSRTDAQANCPSAKNNASDRGCPLCPNITMSVTIRPVTVDGRCVEKICVEVRYKFLKPGGDSLEKRFSLAIAASGYILHHPVPPPGPACCL